MPYGLVQSGSILSGMKGRPISILLVEESTPDAFRLRKTLSNASSAFACQHVTRFSAALERILAGGIDVVLLDMKLRDGRGLDGMARILSVAPNLPIVMLAEPEEEESAIETVQRGAQDYLIKEQESLSACVEKTVRNAIARHHRYAALQSLSLIDELTGLYNRHGFQTLIEQQLKIAQRTQQGLLLALADLDGLKKINDTFGHQEGDRALVAVADVLRTTFRSSDILGRFGGDEFIALAVAAARDSGKIIANRLQSHLADRNAKDPRPYQLSCSLGVALFDPKTPTSIEDLIGEADMALYEQKR